MVRVEFKNVIFHYLHGHMVPMFDFNLPADPDFVSLQIRLDKMQIDKKRPMKMILEWEEGIEKGGD